MLDPLPVPRMVRFRLRMLEKVNVESLMVAAGQNIKRLVASHWRGPKSVAQVAALSLPEPLPLCSRGRVRRRLQCVLRRRRRRFSTRWAGCETSPRSHDPWYVIRLHTLNHFSPVSIKKRLYQMMAVYIRFTMVEKTTLKIRLTKPIRSNVGIELFPGEEFEVIISRNGELIVVFGPYRLPLKQDQWELVITDEDLGEWLAAG
jgi:hypothetical protein